MTYQANRVINGKTTKRLISTYNVFTPHYKSGKTKRATLQKRRVSKSTKTTRTRKTVSPVLSCMTKAHRFLFV